MKKTKADSPGRRPTPRWEIGNSAFELSVGLDDCGRPVLCRLLLRDPRPVEWMPEGEAAVLGPLIAVGDARYRCEDGSLAFEGGALDAADRRLELSYRCEPGLRIRHLLHADPELAALRTWTTVENNSGSEVAGLKRFDALSMRLGGVEAEPQAAYLLGWLDGPRIDSPGRPAAPFPYASWIPRLLYGDGAPEPPAPPEGGWSSPVLRLVQERLTRLPLRSGKRSTYDNHPWAVVLDPHRQAGFFVGFEWSGSWAMDLEHLPDRSVVAVSAFSDSDEHTVAPGGRIDSPTAFLGFFPGDMEAGFNASRRYTRTRILPRGGSTGHESCYAAFSGLLMQGRPDRWREQVDAAAEAGFDTFHVDAMWWSGSPLTGDFSIGLGDFTDSRLKFPDGLRALSDRVHERGMKLSLWFEFERVDIRTANRGRTPWSPAWLVHRNGHPYRSWCQHVFLLCLGAKGAAEWALENLSRAVEDFRVDWFKIDSNEWAVCDDPSHGHGALDGEWAQVQGLYSVLRGLRQRFPRLVIENCAGGSQRGDPGMARFCDMLAPHDTAWPTALVRQYIHGLGSLYPTTSAMNGVGPCPGETGPEGLDPERLEWRLLGRLPGFFCFVLDLRALTPEQRAVFERALATYRRVRRSFLGDRHVLLPPSVLVQLENREPGTWEACQYIAPERDLVSVLALRCMSPEAELRLPLKGLEPGARYRVSWHSGRPESVERGEALAAEGLHLRFEKTRKADVAILQKLS